MDRTDEKIPDIFFFETVSTFGGKKSYRRLKTPVILWTGFLCIPLGLFLLIKYELLFGGTLILTISPCLFIYPIIRGLFFGGKDSVAGVVTTVVVEEVIKSQITKSIEKKSTEKNR